MGEHLYWIATEMAELYRCITPEGLRLPILVIMEAVYDVVPEEAEIEQAVGSIKGGRLGGPYRR